MSHEHISSLLGTEKLEYQEFGSSDLAGVLNEIANWLRVAPIAYVQDMATHKEGRSGWLIRVYYRRKRDV